MSVPNQHFWSVCCTAPPHPLPDHPPLPLLCKETDQLKSDSALTRFHSAMCSSPLRFCRYSWPAWFLGLFSPRKMSPHLEGNEQVWAIGWRFEVFFFFLAFPASTLTSIKRWHCFPVKWNTLFFSSLLPFLISSLCLLTLCLSHFPFPIYLSKMMAPENH